MATVSPDFQWPGNYLITGESGIDADILDSWKRSSVQHRLDRFRPHNPLVLTSSEIRQQLEPLDWLMSVAEPDIKALYGRIKDAGYVVMVADMTGTCVSMHRNPLMERELASGGLELGRIYAESVEGTCGIGLCIADHKPVVVHQRDHFLPVYEKLTCTSVPIDAPDGRMLAVLDVSALSSHEDKRSQLLVLQLARMAAESIENKLILADKRGSPVLVYLYESALVAHGASDAFFLMREDGYIEAASKAAIRLVPQLGIGGQRRIDDCLGINAQLLLRLYSRLNCGEAKIFPPGRDTPLFARVDLSSLRIVSMPDTSRSNGDAKPTDLSAGNSPLSELQNLAGDDTTYRQLVSRVPRVLRNDLPILVLGETGCGKEMFAHAFHRASDRRDKPFIAVDCSSLSETLIESELFGYKDGAFTGARKGGSRGKILEAQGGTLFLDEIGDMPLSMQSRLLRVIAQREVIPLGGTTPIPVYFKLICATHKNLSDMVAAGSFREDLFYRIYGAVFELPSLRERTDKALLIRKLLMRAIDLLNPRLEIAAGLIDQLCELPWPGNIRQLDHAIRYAVSVAEHTLAIKDFPAEICRCKADQELHGIQVNAQASDAIQVSTLPGSVHVTQEAQDLIQALEHNQWQIKATSQSLGISRATIYRRMERYGIVEPNKRPGNR